MKFIEELTFDFIEFLPFNERPFKSKLIPAKIWKDLDKYKDDLSGLKNYCRKWKTKVSFISDDETKISGEYDSTESKCGLFIYSPNPTKINFCEQVMTWREFKYDFIQTLMHEMIHFMQYSNKEDDGKTKVYSYRLSGDDQTDYERGYYSEFGEIQAYAHCIFLDYKANFDESITNMLKRCLITKNSFTLSCILKTFDNNISDNKALRVLIKEVLRWEQRYNN
jgi:hypothetical protein